jgi:hypothetical protein
MDTENKNSFIASKEEIIEITKYHVKEDIDIHYWFFLTGCTGSSESRRCVRANKRINEIVDLNIMSQEEIKKAFDEAYEEYGRLKDPKVWEVFLHGSKEQYEALHTKLMYQFHGSRNWIAYRLWFVRFGYDRLREQVASLGKRITGGAATVFKLMRKKLRRSKCKE